ncbi:peptidase S8/S53 domain-containing protein [Suillus lakei]|nr:peptidase S8/S53 domain-containing protein [Suillus lakei]
MGFSVLVETDRMCHEVARRLWPRLRLPRIARHSIRGSYQKEGIYRIQICVVVRTYGRTEFLLVDVGTLPNCCMLTMRLALLSIIFTAALASAVPFKGYQQKVKESIHAPPNGWYKHAPAPKHHLLELRIALPQPRFPELEQHLLEISDPSHARYGAHLSKQETESLMAPHPETLDIVSEWLALHGLAEGDIIRSSARDWVTIRVPVGLAEKMLTTAYHVYKHAQTGESVIRTMSYSLPEMLHDHIDLIQPTTMFARFKAFKSTLHWTDHVRPAVSSPSGSTITGPAGNQLYNAVDYNTSATNGNALGITGYLNESTNNVDLQQFYQLQNPSAYGSNYSSVSINGGNNNQSYAAAGLEANLDTQFGFGLTWPTPGTFYSTGGEPLFDSDLLTGDGMAALGARGVSVIFSSGDGGVGDGIAYPDKPLKHQCYSNDGLYTPMFLPVFPASCPYVTAVGGTLNIPETAAYFSGGGFSNYFSRPSYQDAAVSAYLAMLTPGTYKGLYNSTGRAYPDVSSQAASFSVVYQGQATPLDGTSCAAPAFAAFVSMLNDARLSAGKTALGFLNPFLYSTGYTALNDITEGRNPGCQTEGFNATVGWDPVTGYGTPNFEKLKDLVLAM